MKDTVKKARKYKTQKWKAKSEIYYLNGSGLIGTGSARKPKDFYDQFKKNQADHILSAFGGPRALARVLKALFPDKKWDPSAIYRWTYPKSKGGTGGMIPSHALPYIVKAARIAGILLPQENFYPLKTF